MKKNHANWHMHLSSQCSLCLTDYESILYFFWRGTARIFAMPYFSALAWWKFGSVSDWIALWLMHVLSTEKVLLSWLSSYLLRVAMLPCCMMSDVGTWLLRWSGHMVGAAPVHSWRTHACIQHAPFLSWLLLLWPWIIFEWRKLALSQSVDMGGLNQVRTLTD